MVFKKEGRNEGRMKMNEELKLLEKFQQDNRWLAENYHQLRKKYLNKFIAVKDKKVIDYDTDFNKLIERLEKKGEDLGRIVIEFMPPEDLILIL